LITVTGNGMLGVPGIAARAFAGLHGRKISVSLISQASSEHSICFSVPEAAADTARQSLIQEFQLRLPMATSMVSKCARAWRRWP